jgi:hypothetical protein
MKNFTVKQIKFTESESELPNELGWNGAMEKCPKWKVKLDLQMDSNLFESNMLEHFTPVFEVQAQDLEHVFRITNLWDEPDLVHTLNVGHSTSVGDLVVDNDTGETFICADFGFDKVA